MCSLFTIILGYYSGKPAQLEEIHHPDWVSHVNMGYTTRGKNQLEKVEVDWSRELSIVRIHVERVIGVLKQKFTILQSVLPIALTVKMIHVP